MQKPESGVAQILSEETRRLGAYIANAVSTPLPDAVREKTKHHTLDTLAAMISGAHLVPGKVVQDFVLSQGGKPEATVAGTRLVVPAIHAAFANAMSAHADETDDSHAPSLSHPGCGVVPAAWAVAELRHCSGDALLKAVALGYDVGCRVTMTLGRDYCRKEHKSTHTVASGFGAHAAASALMGFDEERSRWMLTYAAQQASGTACWQRDLEHIQKAFDFSGGPARNGVASAVMVQHGFTAVDDVFSGPDNYLDAFAHGASRTGLSRELGEVFEIMNGNIKKWPVGSPIQAPLESLGAIVQSYGLRPADIQSLTVRVATTEARVVDNRAMPDICLQHMLALLLVDGTVTFASSHDYERMSDPAILRERAKVTLIHDDELMKTIPRRQAIVDVRTADGRTLSHRTNDVLGTALNPMKRQDVEEKALDLIAPIVGRSNAARLIDSVWRLEEIRDVVELRPLLQLE